MTPLTCRNDLLDTVETDASGGMIHQKQRKQIDINITYTKCDRNKEISNVLFTLNHKLSFLSAYHVQL